MSKTSSAPSSEASSAALARPRRQARSRAKSKRSSQSTCIGPGAASLVCVTTPLLALSLDARQPRERVVDDREILLVDALAAACRQQLAGGRRGQHGHPRRPPGLQGQQQVLLHHVDIEPGLFGELEHERRPVGQRGRGDHAGQHRLDRHLAGDPALLGDQQALAEGRDLHREVQVDGGLHEHGLAVAADVDDLGADRLQDRPDPVEHLGLAADHDRELAAFQGGHAARDRAVEHGGAGGGHLPRQLPGQPGAHGAHVHVDLAGAEAREDAVVPLGHGQQRGRVGHHREDHLGRGRDLARGVCELEPLLDQPGGLGLGAVVAGDVMARVEQPSGDPTAHDPEPDESEVGHAASLAPLRRAPRCRACNRLQQDAIAAVAALSMGADRRGCHRWPVPWAGHGSRVMAACWIGAYTAPLCRRTGRATTTTKLIGGPALTTTSRPAAQGPSGQARRGKHPGLALAVIAGAQLMVVLDATLVNIALPHIQEALHFSTTGLSWVLNAYTLTFGGLLLLGGRAGDILGRRRVFIAGILLFTLASLLGGLASSEAWLLAARALQGVGGAIASPTALALITTNFAEGPERNRAFGVFAAVSGSGAAVGLIAGGMLTSWLSWRWVLFVNVPIGIAIALLARLYINESEPQPGRFDLGGALTSTAGMASLVYGFIRAAASGWGDRVTLGAFAAAVVLLASFVLVELGSEQPITPLHLFANRNRSSAHLIRLLLIAGMFGMFFFITQFVQEVLAFSPLRAGLAFLPTTVTLYGSARLAARLLPRFGPKPLMVGGIAVTTVGMLWLTQVSATTGYVPGLLGPLLLFGIGMGFPFVTLTLVALSEVEPRDTGAASSLVNVVQQPGRYLGLAILVTVFGTASRAAAAHPLAGVAQRVQAQEILVHGIGSAFSTASVFTACALLGALVAIRARPAQEARPGSG